jgi:hypothetical protein
MFDVLYSIILGLIFFYGIYLRVKSFRSNNYYKSFMAGVIIFSSYGLGYPLLFPNRVENMFYQYEVLLKFALPLFIVVTYHIIKYLVKKDFYLSVSKFFKQYLGAFIVSLFILNFNIGDYNIGYSMFFLLLLFLLSSAQGFLGPILSSINIIAILLVFFNSNSISFDVKNIFDFLEVIGIQIKTVKWITVFLSMGLGIFQISENITEIF